MYRFAYQLETIARQYLPGVAVILPRPLKRCGALNHEEYPMLRRITWLIPVLLTASLSGCWLFMPPGGHGGGGGGGGHGGPGGGGGPGYMQPR